MKKITKMTIAIVLVVSMAFVTFGGTLDSAIKEMHGLKDYLSIFGNSIPNWIKTENSAFDVIECQKRGSFQHPFVVSFGEYPQDGTNDMTKQPIEWIILEKSGGKALLISRYILDSKALVNDKENQYSANNPNLGWETSDLRKWLNSDFYNTAFNSLDKSKIIPYSLTSDNVFILNEDELNAYFVLDRKDWEWGYTTESFTDIYYKYHGNPWCATKQTNFAKTNQGEENERYWLRDFKVKPVTTETNDYYGQNRIVGYTITGNYRKNNSNEKKNATSTVSTKYGVRPCIWVTYDDSVKSDREQALEQLGGDVAKNVIGGALDSVLPGSSLLIP